MPKKFGVLPKKVSAPTARDSNRMLAFRVDLCFLNRSVESVQKILCRSQPSSGLLSAAQECYGPLQREGETECADIN